MSDWYVYILLSCCGRRTYVGSTVDYQRRLRQHNREISGGTTIIVSLLTLKGAKYTKSHGPWTRIILIKGLDKTSALCLEWAIKHVRGAGFGLTGRVNALKTLMQKDCWTKKCPAFTVHIECREDLVQSFAGLKWVQSVKQEVQGFLNKRDISRDALGSKEIGESEL